MMKMQQVYCKSATILEEVKDELSSNCVSELHHDFLSLKFMASVIHNDVCREVNNMIANPTTGTSKLLAFGPIILKLLEAKNWYSKVGNKKLCELAKNRGMLASINNKLKEIESINPSRIDKYKKFRHKLVAHYDVRTPILAIIEELGRVPANEFSEDVEMMALYSQKWLQILSSVGKSE